LKTENWSITGEEDAGGLNRGSGGGKLVQLFSGAEINEKIVAHRFGLAFASRFVDWKARSVSSR